MMFLQQKAEKTVDVLKRLCVRESKKMSGILYKDSGYKEAGFIPEIDDSFKPYSGHDVVTKRDAHYWFYCKVHTSPAIEGCRKELYFSDNAANNFQLIVYLNSDIRRGVDPNHPSIEVEPDTDYEVLVYYWSQSIVDYTKLSIFERDIHTETEGLYYDMLVPLEAAEYLDENNEAKNENSIIMLQALECTANLIDFRSPYSAEYNLSVERARDYMKTEFYEKECSPSKVTVNCVGHTHLDVAWRWTVRQTREKLQRSFLTALGLMEQYPEYIFMCSQPQLYEFMKIEQPEAYEKLKQRVAENRWEPEGAMFLEPDCNLTGGESFIRQLMFGKKFMQDEFGKESKILWLPDVFGYSAALPQILRKCGVDKFVTAKISWSDHNRTPYDTFIWKGIDGSEIFSYFLTTHDFINPDQTRDYVLFNGDLSAREIKSTWDFYQQKEYNNDVITTFGYGDGGGGPTAEMLERQKRFAYGLPGYPATRISTVTDFLNTAEANFMNSCKKLGRTPTWQGELYLEYHRGTYTSMAKNKRYNRLSEFLYEKAEGLATIDMLLNNSTYPQNELNVKWKNILLNQFHDILPGSSIKEVYDVTDKEYEEILGVGNMVSENALDNICNRISAQEGFLVYNPNSFECSTVASFEDKKVYVENIPPFGFKVLPEIKCENKVTADDKLLENSFFKITFNDVGEMLSIYDKQNGRELIKKGEIANRFVAYEDIPRWYDAWELTNYYKQKPYAVNSKADFKVIDCGAGRGFEITKTFMNSTITQRIYLYDDVNRIDLEHEIDWHEHQIILKLFFPFDILCNKVTSDIQYGYVERPATSNTSWDQAKFEMCMHKWIDVSDDDYGVSILNDCKYGYGAEGGTLSMTVLKSGIDPNPEADNGLHNFTYSIYPHSGKPTTGGTVKMAYMLNQPLTVKKLSSHQDSGIADSFSLFSFDKENIIAETVKKCENDNNVILRLYDAYNRKTNVKITVGFDFKEVYLCDMLENTEKLLEHNGNTVNTDVSNFEIVTLKFVI